MDKDDYRFSLSAEKYLGESNIRRGVVLVRAPVNPLVNIAQVPC